MRGIDIRRTATIAAFKRRWNESKQEKRYPRVVCDQDKSKRDGELDNKPVLCVIASDHAAKRNSLAGAVGGFVAIILHNRFHALDIVLLASMSARMFPFLLLSL